MGEYRITRRGKCAIGIVVALGLIALIKGSIFLAVFGLLLSVFLLTVSIYEIFINK
ncbi:hypothetical protein [Fusibacter ferrireducens]|uniref:Phosphatidate cytidylyltransferase n=1 Tax=Fusibacter ferrireducens TaxID=2785058 RepID=A0ABR9ZUH8_9FIRM|nr:hypothetical protein [Fusibacter ferrireducens]MBF4694134.1 hypothetical protein [Fusibacter ferrireducens]